MLQRKLAHNTARQHLVDNVMATKCRIGSLNGHRACLKVLAAANRNLQLPTASAKALKGRIPYTEIRTPATERA